MTAFPKDFLLAIPLKDFLLSTLDFFCDFLSETLGVRLCAGLVDFSGTIEGKEYFVVSLSSESVEGTGSTLVVFTSFFTVMFASIDFDLSRGILGGCCNEVRLFTRSLESGRSI